jgi:hypothetical protein
VLSEQTTEEAKVPKQAEAPDVSEEEPEETIPSLYAELATTSRDGIPAVIDQDNTPQGTRESNRLAESLTHPSSWLQSIYMTLSLLVLVALGVSIAIEWRRQHPVQIAYAGGLIATMAVLMQVHTALTSGVTIL